MSSTPSTVYSYTYAIWTAKQIQIPMFGGSAREVKSVNLGSPSQIQIVSAVFRGSIEKVWSGITAASFSLKVDGEEMWKEEWIAIGGRRDKTLDLTSKLAGGGVHTFEADISSSGSDLFVLDGYLDVQYIVLTSGATIPTEVTTVTTAVSLGGVQSIISFVESIVPLAMLIILVSIFKSITQAFKSEEGKKEK